MLKNILISSAVLLLLSSCAITRPLSASKIALSPCPWTPNCVSTEAESDGKRIDAFELAVDINTAWPSVVRAVEALEGASIEQQRLGYLYAKVASSAFKFIDYVEVLYVPNDKRLAVRSSARLGFSDMGVNRQRTQQLRTLLHQQNVIR